MHKIGIFNWYGYVEPFEKRVEQIKKAGYDHLMLWWEDESYPKHIDRRDFIKIVKSHDFINGQSCGGILEKWKDILFCVHLSDCDGLSDKHWMPGKGLVNWEKIIPIVKDTDCKRFSMETYPYESEKELTSLEFIEKARESILKLL